MTTPNEHLADLSVAELARRTGEREVSAVDLVEACLARIAERDPALNAFSVVLADEARAEAAARDRAIAEGQTPGPLHGVPVAIKEEIDVAGCVTTFGGRANSTPAAVDGEVVRRLRDAGAVVIGKTRMPEFGQWPFTESVDGGYTRNPWKIGHTPGGSSGGTAVAVAAGMVPVGIGGDGGGSIRIPSACCGLFGLKPQRGRVTTAPMEHLWWSLGTVGPLTRSVLDSAIVYDAIRGNTATDLFRATDPATTFTEAARSEPGRLRIGWSTKSPIKGMRPDRTHVEAVTRTAQLLSDLGHEVVEADPRYPDATLAFVPQFFAGVRAEADAVEHYERLEKRTRETYRLGSWVRPGVVQWALRTGEKVSAKANRVFAEVDVLLTPSIAHRPRTVGALDKGGTVRAALAAQPMIAYAALWNIAGNPAASVPAGVAADGLPLAVQLVGRQHDETTLLSLSAQLEAARPWTMPVLG
ncbi:amidase [Marmoricola sp. URHB0036]|uniref:amidase n=1 Tax=Marmoricola sp. URHB0036 TaxID=1298863 RepID=UPI00041978FF|nr:amidase [Marmoricola sp. URHB0036]